VLIANAEPTFRNCSFLGCAATGQHGGAMYISGGEPLIEECVFNGNTAVSGAGGAVFTIAGGNPTFVDCVFEENESFEGGAVASIQTSPIFISCFILNNTSLYGAVMIMGPTYPVFDKTIIAFNSGSSVACSAGPNEDPVEPTFTCCNIWGNGTDWTACFDEQLGIDGNISEDPKFCDPLAAPSGGYNPECGHIVGYMCYKCVCGDADNSGGWDIDDVVEMLDIIFGFSGDPEALGTQSIDVDCSGEFDIDDVVYLLLCILGGGPPPCCIFDCSA